MRKIPENSPFDAFLSFPVTLTNCNPTSNKLKQLLKTHFSSIPKGAELDGRWIPNVFFWIWFQQKRFSSSSQYFERMLYYKNAKRDQLLSIEHDREKIVLKIIYIIGISLHSELDFSVKFCDDFHSFTSSI